MKALTDLGKASITDCQKVIGGKIGQDYIYSLMEEEKALISSSSCHFTLIHKMNDFCSAVKSQKHLLGTEILVETFYIKCFNNKYLENE